MIVMGAELGHAEKTRSIWCPAVSWGGCCWRVCSRALSSAIKARAASGGVQGPCLRCGRNRERA